MQLVWIAFFGLSSALAVGLASLSGDRANLLVALGALCLWAISTYLWQIERLDLLPLFDWLLGMTAFFAWMGAPSKWAMHVIMIFYLRLAAHTVNEFTLDAFYEVYAYVLNGLFVILLWVVAEPGGRNGAHRFRDFRRARSRRHSAAAAHRASQ